MFKTRIERLMEKPKEDLVKKIIIQEKRTRLVSKIIEDFIKRDSDKEFAEYEEIKSGKEMHETLINTLKKCAEDSLKFPEVQEMLKKKAGRPKGTSKKPKAQTKKKSAKKTTIKNKKKR